MPSARLVLADRSVFEGRSVGVPGTATGEVVFNTSMTGYQEMLTDPSYAGQLLVLTYPMIGNYGSDPAVEESGVIQPVGLIVREMAPFASHLRSEGELSETLVARGVVAIDQIDTRAVTRRIRRHGVMSGMITTELDGPTAAQMLQSTPDYDAIDWATKVTAPEAYDWTGSRSAPPARYRIALLDGGVKRNIMRSLALRGCAVRVYPLGTSAEDLAAGSPDGFVLSPGPGNPEVLESVVTETRKLIGRAPVLGICLGHQVIGKALGCGSFKLPFGHRGGNHPVKDTLTGNVTITAQNHGYALDADGLESSAYVSHVNLNDQTVEGLAMHTEPLLTIQYHSEACPGPLDSMSIFDRFVAMMAGEGGGSR